jgi:hypothetical protein
MKYFKEDKEIKIMWIAFIIIVLLSCVKWGNVWKLIN